MTRWWWCNATWNFYWSDCLHAISKKWKTIQYKIHLYLKMVQLLVVHKYIKVFPPLQRNEINAFSFFFFCFSPIFFFNNSSANNNKRKPKAWKLHSIHLFYLVGECYSNKSNCKQQVILFCPRNDMRLFC